MSDFAPDRLLAQREHRPWPLPGRGWILRQEWHDLLFAHWTLPPERVRPLVPPELPLDLFDGRAWVGVVPFLVRDSRARALPAVPGATDFLELNVRTYVTLAGRAGVYFFSLDAQSALAVLGARAFYRLPYHEAAMQRTHEAGWTEYRSNRASGGAELVVRYRSTGDVYHAAPGSLDHFLVERYCLFTTGRRGRPWRTDIHHPPWPLQPAEAEFTENTMAETNGIILPNEPPVLHYAAFQPVLIWPPAPVR
jgi:hypothetical protein